jgi:hypothetical protein
MLEMKTLRRQPTVHAAAWSAHLYKSYLSIQCTPSFIISYYLVAINVTRVSPTGSVPSRLPLTHNNELEKDLLQALYYIDDEDRRHRHV